jgi:hypothetical protein
MDLGGLIDPPTPISLAGFQVFSAADLAYVRRTLRLKTGQRFLAPLILSH